MFRDARFPGVAVSRENDDRPVGMAPEILNGVQAIALSQRSCASAEVVEVHASVTVEIHGTLDEFPVILVNGAAHRRQFLSLLVTEGRDAPFCHLPGEFPRNVESNDGYLLFAGKMENVRVEGPRSVPIVMIRLGERRFGKGSLHPFIQHLLAFPAKHLHADSQREDRWS